MQNYNLPAVNRNNTFDGVVFVLPTNAVYDLTGAVIKLHVKIKPEQPIIKQFSDFNITLPHTIEFPAQVIKIPAGTYLWDLKIVFADGREKTYIGGNWIINPVITE